MLIPFYLLFSNKPNEQPYMFGKVHAISKEKAAEYFLNSFKTPSNWYTHEEMMQATKELHELSEKEIFWLKEKKML